MTRFGATELAGLLDEFVDEVGGDAPARRAWLADMRDAMLPDLPGEPAIEPLDAWLELVELLSDPDFRTSLRGMGGQFWENAGSLDMEAFRAANRRVVEAATAALDEGVSPADPESERPSTCTSTSRPSWAGDVRTGLSRPSCCVPTTSTTRGRNATGSSSPGSTAGRGRHRRPGRTPGSPRFSATG